MVGIDEGSVLCILANDGQIAVMQTATSLPPFQPILRQDPCGLLGSGLLTLDGTPDEIQKDPLQQGDITPAKAPGKPVLNGKANVPTKSTPGNECREEGDQQLTNHDHHHTLTRRKSIS